MTRLLITGARGQLGSDLMAAAAAAGVPATGLGSAELDITDPVAVDAAVQSFARAAEPRPRSMPQRPIPTAPPRSTSPVPRTWPGRPPTRASG
jgi:nucleoside-diphosphate-sugar epimerase